MKNVLMAVALSAALCGASFAAELTLGDAPSILNKLRRCSPGVIYGKNCELSEDRVWMSIHANRVAFYYRTEASNYKDEAIYGFGKTPAEALASLIFKLNARNADGKRAVEAIGDLLPTQ